MLKSAIALVLLSSAPLFAADWKAGTGKANITPKRFMWMSGYAARNRPADAKLTDLWAKVLVVQDPTGNRVCLITLDLVGIDRDTSLAIRKRLRADFHLGPAQVAICCSHTHTGPVVGTNLKPMYALSRTQWDQVEEYTKSVANDAVKAVGQAIRNLAGARLSWAVGKATFAVNRRENRERDIATLRRQNKLKGPVDHDVPVLKVADIAGKPIAIVFGYACHATVLSFYKWSGDYPGFAQIAIEKQHPTAQAMFWAGCGADQNPLPRRKVEHARSYGERLAKAVCKVLDSKMKPINGRLQTAFTEIDLRFGKLPAKQQIEADTKSKNRYVAGRAQLLLEQIKRDGALKKTYPYPIQTWRIGKDVMFITLGGEVVVDFSLRLKRELGGKTTWVAGYANDVMAYIPSRRVLREGGYEGGGAMVYYGLPASWAPQVEDDIIHAVRKQAKTLRTK